MTLDVFADKANRFTKSPLGILGLFLVLVYGIAGIVAVSGEFQSGERLILVWFLVLFPVAVLIVLYMLVTKHQEKLYAPSDFQNEENFLRVLETRVREVGEKVELVE